jgi:hypothetical protein
MENPFNITKEEVLELAATKLVYSVTDDSSLYELAESKISKLVNDKVAAKLDSAIDAALQKEIAALMEKEIVPIDIWGEKAGSPTTIRSQLHERAKEFWNVSVDDSGEQCHYGGSPRHEVLFKKIVQTEFETAIKQNAEVVVGEFKKALLEDSTRIVTEHINKLIGPRR